MAYLLKGCYQQGEFFFVDERVLIPRSHLGEILRSYSDYSRSEERPRYPAQTELQYEDYFPSYVDASTSDDTGRDGLEHSPGGPLPARRDVRRVLDLCTGSACLAILAARQFLSREDGEDEEEEEDGEDVGRLHVDAVDISPDALAVARINLDAKGLQELVSLHLGDLYSALPLDGDGKGERRRYDLIVCNPPYVPSSALAALPPEYLREPFKLACDGGEDGIRVLRRVIDEAADHLTETAGAGLLLEVGGSGFKELRKAYPRLFVGAGRAGRRLGDRVVWLRTKNSRREVFFIPRKSLTAENLSEI